MANPEHEEAPPRADSPPESVSDRSLLRRLQRGQADASTELYVRYAERLRTLAAAQSSPGLRGGSTRRTSSNPSSERFSAGRTSGITPFRTARRSGSCCWSLL